MQYRRSQTPGATYFFTVNLSDRRLSLLTDNIDLLRKVVCKVQQRHLFDIVAMVILPDHLHAIWKLPEGDNNYPLRWSLIKSSFSRAIAKTEKISSSRQQKRERGIWQRRYWEHQIRDDIDLNRHIDYIHYNPVKHGYAKSPVDWPYSSIHRYIKHKQLTEKWAGYDKREEYQFGE